MQTLILGKYRATLSPTRNVGEFKAKLSKCTGKYKPTSIKTERRQYPYFMAGQSTAEYVAMYARLNGWSSHAGFFEPPNDAPHTLYSGTDSHEEELELEECFA